MIEIFSGAGEIARAHNELGTGKNSNKGNKWVGVCFPKTVSQ